MKIGKYIALAASTALALSACSTGATEGEATTSSGSDTTSAAVGTSTDNSASGDATQVTTSMYPVSYLVSEIGADRVTIHDLTPPGGDAHGLELSPREIADMENSEALFYIGNLSASMDEAAQTARVDHIVELGENADLKSPEELGVDPHAHDHSEGEATEDEHADHDHGPTDPHFWTDPARMSMIVPTIVDTLSEIDPEGAEEFKTNGEKVAAELDALAVEYSDALGSERCETQTFVTTHEAFAYLADANGLTQLGIAGIDPDTEPSPARIREVATLMEEAGTQTIFATSSSERAGAEALTSETDSTVEILNPVASQPEDGDYLSALKDNLAQLEAAMGCQ